MMTDLIQQIKEARKKAGLTQLQLASFYGIPRRTVEDWERGVHEPPEYVANLLLRCLDYDFSPKEEPAEQSEPEVLSAPKTLTFLDNLGRPFKEPVLSAVKRAYDDGKVQDLGSDTFDYDDNRRPDLKGKLYMITEPEIYNLDMGLTFYVKEV